MIGCVDSSTVEAEGGMMGRDGFKYREDLKIHVCVDGGSMLLSIALEHGNKHDSSTSVSFWRA